MYTEEVLARQKSIWYYNDADRYGGMKMDAKGIIIWAVFIVICAAIYFISRNMKKQIEENGIETTGVISRIEDEGGTEDITFTYYAKYLTEDGEEVEGIISNPVSDLAEGQQVRLKYHPKHKMNARLI